MIAYSVIGDINASRVLTVVKQSAHRFRFFITEGTELVPVKFTTAGGKRIAVVSGLVMVFKIPNSNDLHREIMAHNARSQWIGLSPDFDRVLDNMLDYVESI